MMSRVLWWMFSRDTRQSDSTLGIVNSRYFLPGLMTTLFCASIVDAQDETAAPGAGVSLADRQQQIEGLRTSEDSATAVKHLLGIDANLRGTKQAGEIRLQRSVLLSLAEHATPAALEYLRSVFETQTARRHDAAYAISVAAIKRPTNDQDWRYLVRSLPIVRGDEAVSILKTLRRFRRRATKGSWVREVILIGLTLNDEQLPAAIELLTFWTGHPVDAMKSSRKQLADFQIWFDDRYSEEPSARLPTDAAGAKWTLTKLSDVISDLPEDVRVLATGADVYVKANCNKCHRREGIVKQPADDRLGPNLSSLGWRRQPREILSAILYPSHRLNDEYPVTTVLLQSGKTHSGLLMPDKDGRLKVVAADSKETSFHKDELEESIPANVSNMPTGLLEPLSPEEIRSLFGFLTDQTGNYEPHRR